MNPYLFGAFDLGGGAGDEVGRALAHVRVVLRQADGPHAADAALAHVPEGEDGLSQDLLNTCTVRPACKVRGFVREKLTIQEGFSA